MPRRTPEDWDRTQRLIENGREARANMQAIIERSQARRNADEIRRRRGRELLRRLLTVRRAA
jgi:hypothetical protein